MTTISLGGHSNYKSRYLHIPRAKRVVRGMTINIDLDFTIRAIDRAISAKSNFKIMASDFTEWDPGFLGERIGMTPDEFLAWMGSEEIEWSAKPYPHIFDALAELKGNRNKIQIVTANAHHDLSHQWLERERLMQFVDDVIFTSDKLAVAGDVLIDDSPFIIKKFLDAGRPIVRRWMGWNAHLTAAPSFLIWHSAVKAVKSVKEAIYGA